MIILGGMVVMYIGYYLKFRNYFDLINYFLYFFIVRGFDIILIMFMLFLVIIMIVGGVLIIY